MSAATAVVAPLRLYKLLAKDSFKIMTSQVAHNPQQTSRKEVPSHTDLDLQGQVVHWHFVNANLLHSSLFETIQPSVVHGMITAIVSVDLAYLSQLTEPTYFNTGLRCMHCQGLQ